MGNSFKFADLQLKKVSLGEYQVSGWVKTHRQSKNISFIELSDGSSVKGLQLVIEPNLATYAPIADRVSTGSSIIVSGKLVESPAKGQTHEFQVSEIALVGEADPEKYFLQKKHHGLDTLRENLHFRPRSNTFGAVFRIRSNVAFAVHKFFKERGFYYIHTPIITTSDCEGAGEMFQVTTLKPGNAKVDYTQDFFKAPAFLTVSGQLEGEIFATALGKIYTFGPTFRAENSNTSRHLSEFWMIEPEISFCDLAQDMQVASDFIKYLISYTLEESAADLEFLHQAEWCVPNLRANLEAVVNKPAEVLEYTEAIKILENATQAFEYPVSWGIDLQSEHERYLTEKHVQGPVFVINYPKTIKPFYMRLNDDEKTVTGMDLLTPGIGEIIGGGQREDRLDLLTHRMQAQGLDVSNYWWYLQLREFGSVPHAGFGLGFERFLMYVTGMKNIRDVIPVPRYPGHGGI